MGSARAPIGVLAAVLSLLPGIALPCLAGSGYRTQYDFPGHGDDWYGSPGTPQQRRDFPAPFVDLILSGEDFCRGYDPLFDRLGLGPPLVRTQTAQGEYDFRFGDADPSMACIGGAVPDPCDDQNPCTYDFYDPVAGHCSATPVADGTACSDGLFCNGAETCQGGTCRFGAPPDCDDADACTIDSCDRFTDACAHAAPPPPAPPANLLVSTAAPGNPFAVLQWDPVPGAQSYSVYRAASSDLSDLVCLLVGLPTPDGVDDGDVPGPGRVHYLLATSEACGVESTLGFGTFGERINPAPCF